MNRESSPIEEHNPKEVYFHTIKSRVDSLLSEGRLTDVYAAGVIERAGYVEGPFEDASAAEESAQGFLTAIETMAAFIDKLNLTEIQLVALSGDVELRKEEIAQREDFSEDKKRHVLEDLQGFTTEIDSFVKKVQAARSNID